MTAIDYLITTETPDLAGAIEALADRAFGPGRQSKTSYRLREGTNPIDGLSLVAFDGGKLVGTIRFSPILIGDSRCLLLGPLAVDPDHKGKGCGISLMRRGLDLAREMGFSRVILVGDEPYYAKVGFSKVPAGRITLPGPVDPDRLLWLELQHTAFESVGGMAQPDTAFAAA